MIAVVMMKVRESQVDELAKAVTFFRMFALNKRINLKLSKIS
jgi:hypothetical protein